MSLQSTDDNHSVADRAQSSSKISTQPPPSFYKDKYRHLLGTDSGKDAARATKSNSAYGYGQFTSFLSYLRSGLNIELFMCRT